MPSRTLPGHDGWSASGTAVRRVYVVFSILFGLLMLAGLLGYRATSHPANDFFAFHSFSRFIHRYPAALLYDQEMLRQFQALPDHKLFAFMYHPGMMLLLWPLADLPYDLGYVVWMAIGLVACGLAVAGSRKGWPGALLLAVAPSTLWTMLCGQSSLLVAALIVGGMRMAPRRPVLGGILLGLATYKPQLGLLVPVALIAAERWRTLGVASATASCIVVASTAAFGIPVWPAWFHHLSSIVAVRSAHAIDWAPLLVTVSSNLALSGVGRQVADLLQALACAGAILCVWHCFRTSGRHQADGDATLLDVAVLGVATFLATPFAFNYDLPLFTASVLLFADERRRSEGVFQFREILVIVIALLLPCFILVGWLDGSSSIVMFLVLCTVLNRIRVRRTGRRIRVMA